MKRRWVLIGFSIVFVALLGLWVEERRSSLCENCGAKEQPFFQVFSSPTTQDEARIKKFSNLAHQTYRNFRVAISADEARYPDVQGFIEKYPDRFVKLPDGYQSQELMYRWIHSVPAGDIIVLFPSDGALDEGALDHLKNFYSGSAAWLAFQGDIKRWAQDGVLTGYANLFQKIKLQEFLDHGSFSENSAPENRLFELAGRHVRRIRGNIINGKNYGYSWIARSRKPYPRFRPDAHVPPAKTDLIIFSDDNPLQLYAVLESIHAKVAHVDGVSVIYYTSSPLYDQGYDLVKKEFSAVNYLKQDTQPENEFKMLVRKAVFGSSNPYILFAADDVIVRESFDLQEGIKQMEKTGAVGVYYSLGQQSDAAPPSIKLDSQLFAWQFSAGRGLWQLPYTTDMALYRKKEIKDFLKNIDFHHSDLISSKWKLKRKDSGVGIYYASPKAVTLPLKGSRFTTEQLLNTFLHGLKLDIKPLQEYRDFSAHADLPVTFIAQDEVKF